MSIHPPSSENAASTVVQKYGGSSVADVPRLRMVAQRVVDTAKSGKRVVVVVSAMGNTTDELLALARSVSSRPGRRELDLLVSVGERVSMTLLAMAIEDLGVPAASFTGSQSGIITDENHVAAKVIEVRPFRVQQALDEGRVAIVAGFQGVSKIGKNVTTLGRGGSDTTAVVLAAALGAAHCEICSDVDGVYTADPRNVPEAEKLDTLPLDAALDLARSGSKVLLAEALEQARRLGVTLAAAATTQPSGMGTTLPPGPAPDAVVAVARDDSLLHICTEPHCAPDEWKGAVRMWWRDQGRTHALIDTRNLHEDNTLPDTVEIIGPVATVSAVGQSAVQDPDIVARAVAALGERLIHWTAGGTVWTGIVKRASAAESERILHQALVTRT